MTESPFMITSEDKDLVGGSGRSDPMGHLAIWSERGRDLVPHLTEQTTDVRGFQVLVEAYRLWELYVRDNSQRADQDQFKFFLLVEQAFARTVGKASKAGLIDLNWSLPGARRVRARANEVPQISLRDASLHLLGGQGANGIWGLYRGAARRAGLLKEGMAELSDETKQQVKLRGEIDSGISSRLFPLIQLALDGKTVELFKRLDNQIAEYLYVTFRNLPLAQHFHERLVKSHDLTRKLAPALLAAERSSHDFDCRLFLAQMKKKHPKHLETITNVERCETVLATVESAFLWLCTQRGKGLEAVSMDLPGKFKLADLEKARLKFGDSGTYTGKTASDRHKRLRDGLDTSSNRAFLGSVLELHRLVSEERGQAPWVWEDQGKLSVNVEVGAPPNPESWQVGKVWRNSYYLKPLQNIARQLAEAKK